MTRPDVNVDLSAAARALKILPYIRRRESPPPHLVAALVATPGISLWLRHMSQSGRPRDEQWYREVIRQAALAEKSTDMPFHVFWLRTAAAREGELNRILTALGGLGFAALCERAFAAAEENLDIPFSAPIQVLLVCGTRGGAIDIDKAIVWDIADFSDPSVTPLPLDLIEATLAHEIFHFGRTAQAQAKLRPRTGTGGHWAYTLLDMLVEEGSATYLFTKRFAPAMNGPAWGRAMNDLPSVVNRISAAMIDGVAAPEDCIELRDRINAFFGVEGYALGSESCRVIDRHLGRDALRQLLRDCRLMPRLHNEAADRAGLAVPRFPAEVVTAAEAL